MTAPLEMLAGVVAGTIVAPTPAPVVPPRPVPSHSTKNRRPPSLSPVSSATTIPSSAPATSSTTKSRKRAAAPAARKTPAFRSALAIPPNPPSSSAQPPAKRLKSAHAQRLPSPAPARSIPKGSPPIAQSRSTPASSPSLSPTSVAPVNIQAMAEPTQAPRVRQTPLPSPSPVFTSCTETPVANETTAGRKVAGSLKNDLPKNSRSIHNHNRAPQKKKELEVTDVLPPSLPGTAPGKDEDNERRALRAERNRQSAAASRERKKRHVKELEAHVRQLTDMISSLQHKSELDAQDWLAKEQRLHDENNTLRAQLTDALARCDPLSKPPRQSHTLYQQIDTPNTVHSSAPPPPRISKSRLASDLESSKIHTATHAHAEQQLLLHQPTLLMEAHHPSTSERSSGVTQLPTSVGISDYTHSRHRIAHVIQAPSHPEQSAQSVNRAPHASQLPATSVQHLSHIVHSEPMEQSLLVSQYVGLQQSAVFHRSHLPSPLVHAVSSYQHMPDFTSSSMESNVPVSSPPVHAGCPRPLQ